MVSTDSMSASSEVAPALIKIHLMLSNTEEVMLQASSFLKENREANHRIHTFHIMLRSFSILTAQGYLGPVNRDISNTQLRPMYWDTISIHLRPVNWDITSI